MVHRILLILLLPSLAMGAGRRQPAQYQDPAWEYVRNLGISSRSQRKTFGIIFASTGLLFSGAYIAQQRLRTGEPKRLAEGVLAVSGGISLLGSLAFFLFESSDETESRRMLRRKNRSVHAARAFLDRAGSNSGANRTLIGGALLALGAADVAWHLAEGGSPDTSFLAYKGVLLGVMGVGFLSFPWVAERVRDSYLLTLPKVTITPIPSGAGLSLAWEF